MNRSVAVLMLVMAMVCCLVGCAKRKVTTIRGPEGERVTVEAEKGGEKSAITIETKEGTAKLEITPQADLSKLGVAIYPGAKQESSGTYKSEAKKDVEVTSAALTTPDSFEKVAEFYKAKYAKGASLVQQKGDSLFIVTEKKGKQMTIAVSRKEGADKTTIAITITPKS